MKVVVRKKFKDKYTDETYEAGNLMDLAPERYEEIRETNPDLVIAVADEPGQQARAQRMMPRRTRARLSRGQQARAQQMMPRQKRERLSLRKEARRAKSNVCLCVLQQQ